MGHTLCNEALNQEMSSHLRMNLSFLQFDFLIAHRASCSDGRMILSKREGQLPLADCLIHNPIEFKDARLIDGVDIDRND